MWPRSRPGSGNQEHYSVAGGCSQDANLDQPASNTLRDKLRPVVAADVRRNTADRKQILQHTDHIIRREVPPHALITQASSAATTDPDSDTPCLETGPYRQGNIPGAGPLSSTRPDCTD
jgi:hypothetical protein